MADSPDLSGRGVTPLTVAALGCGARTQTYVSLMARYYPHQFSLVAAADPQAERAGAIQQLAGTPRGFRSFGSFQELLAEERLADMAIIGTQDADHHEAALAAMEKGYDLLLEKPVATTREDVLSLADTAERRGRRVMVCHVLRFAPLYQTIRAVVDSGELGEIRSANATEGVGPWHFAHSYVRGHWNRSTSSSPLILAKSCHDLDILSWIMGDPCVSVSSAGCRSFFSRERCPPGAPDRCTRGCPHGEHCLYNAERYTDRESRWLSLVWDGDGPMPQPHGAARREKIRQWLTHSPWGRCVWQCDNDQPDHQTAQFQFSRGQTATFTVTAFATGRTLELYGTAGTLRAGDDAVEITSHHTGETRTVPLYAGDSPALEVHPAGVVPGEYREHGGGDFGLISRLYEEITAADPSAMTTGIAGAVESHRMAFAAEESRRTGRTVFLSDARRRRGTSGVTPKV